MSRVTPQISADKTRLAVSVPSATYLRLSNHCGTGPGAFWQFVTRAIEAELERTECVSTNSNERRS